MCGVPVLFHSLVCWASSGRSPRTLGPRPCDLECPACCTAERPWLCAPRPPRLQEAMPVVAATQDATFSPQLSDRSVASDRSGRLIRAPCQWLLLVCNLSSGGGATRERVCHTSCRCVRGFAQTKCVETRLPSFGGSKIAGGCTLGPDDHKVCQPLRASRTTDATSRCSRGQASSASWRESFRRLESVFPEMLSGAGQVAHVASVLPRLALEYFHPHMQDSWNVNILMGRIRALCASEGDGHAPVEVSAFEEDNWEGYIDVSAAVFWHPVSHRWGTWVGDCPSPLGVKKGSNAGGKGGTGSKGGVVKVEPRPGNPGPMEREHPLPRVNRGILEVRERRAQAP